MAGDGQANVAPQPNVGGLGQSLAAALITPAGAAAAAGQAAEFAATRAAMAQARRDADNALLLAGVGDLLFPTLVFCGAAVALDHVLGGRANVGLRRTSGRRAPRRAGRGLAAASGRGDESRR